MNTGIVSQHRPTMLLRKYFGVFLYLYLQIVKISCEEGSTLAFAIDDTNSMWDDISYVKKGAKAIMDLVFAKKNSTIKDLVLVTINDPTVVLRTKTNSQSTFLYHLNSITLHSRPENRDCEEMSLTGMETALTNSRPESYIYVFTDAGGKDYYKLDKIKSLCQKKQSQVVIVYTISRGCISAWGKMVTVYYDIAKACSGQVFYVEKEQVNSVLKTIEILLQGKNAIFKWITVPRTSTFVPVEFTLDEKAEYAIVSTSGINVDLKITTDKSYWSPQPTLQSTMWNANGKIVKLVNPKPGTYYAWVKGDSTISIVVYGRTDFTFEHGFSVLQPKSMADTAKQPIAGLTQFLSINVTDPDNSVNIQSVQILDIANNDLIISNLPLRNIGKNFYITNAFVSPSYTFRIAVKGEVKKNHETIMRNSRTNIDPAFVDIIPESNPVIKIEEGLKLDVNYGSTETLTCKVSAHPAPKIEWYTSSGRFLPSESSVVDAPAFVSYLKLTNIKQNETYVCKASNKRGAGTDSIIQVGVRPVFTHRTNSKETVYNAKYGEDVKITCNIKSYQPITIKWYLSDKELSTSGVYSISPDGSELTLKSIDVDMQGKYTCKATLNSDPTMKHIDNTDVKITGLVQPTIHNEESTFYGAEGDSVIKIPCNVTGFPEPTVIWKIGGKSLSMGSKYVFKRANLYINNLVLSDSAEYTCIAGNKVGNATKTFNVEVVDSLEGEENLNGDSHEFYAEQEESKNINCNLKNVGKSSVRWYVDGMLTKQTGSTYTIERVSAADERNYTCRVNTDEGSKSETYILYVGFLPRFDDSTPSPITFDWRDDNQVLDCTADSRPPSTYEWLHNGKPVTGNNLKQVTDWGEYTCTVSNVLGKIQKTFKVITSGCYITYNIATQSQPLIADMNKPMWPVSMGNDGVMLYENQEIKLSCSNNSISANTFKILPNKTEIAAKCNIQDKLTVDGNTYNYSDLQCNTKVEPTVAGTHEQCNGPNSEMIRVGFEVNGFLEAYKVCLDKRLNVPLYASASAYILSISDGVDLAKFEWSFAPEVGSRKARNWERKGSCKCCYTRGQLVNVNEVAFGPAQAATFNYNLNSIPVWNPCDESRKSWQTFDDESREAVLYEKWSSWTGASEYVSKDGGLVPRYLWKVMNSDEGFSVMVYVNDREPLDSDVRCSSTSCTDSQVFEVEEFLYCCNLEEFSKKFGVPLNMFKAV